MTEAKMMDVAKLMTATGEKLITRTKFMELITGAIFMKLMTGAVLNILVERN